MTNPSIRIVPRTLTVNSSKQVNTIKAGDPRLVVQAARDLKELFRPSNAGMTERSDKAKIPMLTNSVVEPALAKSKINAKNEITQGNLKISPDSPYYIDGVQYNKDYKDYSGNPILALVQLINHGNLGKAEHTRADLSELKRLYPALHKVIRDPNNAQLLEEVLNSQELTIADKKGSIGKSLRTLIDNIEEYRVGQTFERKDLKTI